MRRTPKRTTFSGVRSRGYRCRLERLESRSMMAADIVASVVDVVPDEPPVVDQADEMPVDEWPAWDLQVCDLWAFDDEPACTVDPTFIDDSCLMVTEPPQAFEPVDIRVQFVSSEQGSGWAAYYYTVGADGMVQGVSVVASYDEPTIAAFVAEHADDPSFEIFDDGDGWWIGGFPQELAPPVPDYGVFCGGGFGGGMMAWDEPVDRTTWDGADSLDVAGYWSWDESGAYMWDQPMDAWGQREGVDVDGTSTWDDSGMSYDWYDDGSGAIFSCGWSWNDWYGGDWYGDDGASYVDETGFVYTTLESRNDWTGGDGTFMPLFYARGAGMAESFGSEGAAYAMPGNADPAVAVQDNDVTAAEPATASPRSAAFADMGAMAAAATAAQAHAVDAPVVGGGRRRR